VVLFTGDLRQVYSQEGGAGSNVSTSETGR
jgi:hypothetical protein